LIKREFEEALARIIHLLITVRSRPVIRRRG
jgi:hypothetical protein